MSEFMSGCHYDSDLFRKYFHKIFPDNAVEDAEACFYQVPIIAKSFGERGKGPLVKIMRWFSWFDNFKYHKREWWAAKTA